MDVCEYCKEPIPHDIPLHRCDKQVIDELHDTILVLHEAISDLLENRSKDEWDLWPHQLRAYEHAQAIKDWKTKEAR